MLALSHNLNGEITLGADSIIYYLFAGPVLLAVKTIPGLSHWRTCVMFLLYHPLQSPESQSRSICHHPKGVFSINTSNKNFYFAPIDFSLASIFEASASLPAMCKIKPCERSTCIKLALVLYFSTNAAAFLE